MEKLITTDPSTGLKLQEYAAHTKEEVREILRRSGEAQKNWRKVPITERVAALARLSELLLSQKTSLAELMRAEMGKSVSEGAAETEKCAAGARFYAENAAHILEPRNIPTEARKSYVSFEPLGTVLAIMPWNFPLWQVVRCAAPALAAGNSVVLKHASNVTGCALALERLFAQALGREDLFRVLLVPGNRVLALIPEKEIRAVSLTGSTAVGRQVAAVAGHELKKCVLELGGSDAYVVLHDADLSHAAKTCAYSRLINVGQSCIAAKRFVVVKSVVEKFTKLFVEEMTAAKLAPMARMDLRTELHRQVEKALSQGAKLLCGGEIPAGPGAYYPATVLAEVRPGNLAFEEELFGPVAAVIEARDETDAIALANQSSFGLGAAVFTKDSSRAETIARFELEAGSCFANTFVRSDPRLPFGGIKDSGYGRELADFGLREFTNIKTVFVT